MDSVFYTFEEAAKRLGRSTRSIHNYVKHGYIRKTMHETKSVLYKDDVEQLLLEEGLDLPAMNHKNFRLLLAKVHKLEEDMAICRKILDIQKDPLRPSASEAKELLLAAQQATNCSEWRIEEIEMWISIFDRLDDVTLDLFIDFNLAEKTMGLLKLCVTLMKFVSTRPEFKSSLKLQSLHKGLDEGRKKMKSSIPMWLSIRGYPIPSMTSNTTMLTTEADKGTLFAKLGWHEKKS